MISEESSAKPGIVLCPHYHFLLWNWKSMSSAVLVYDFLCLVQHYVCTTPAKPSLPRVIQKSLTINNSDGGMRNVLNIYVLEKQVSSFACKNIAIFVSLTCYQHTSPCNFVHVYFLILFLLYSKKRKLTSSQASNFNFLKKFLL